MKQLFHTNSLVSIVAWFCPSPTPTTFLVTRGLRGTFCCPGLSFPFLGSFEAKSYSLIHPNLSIDQPQGLTQHFLLLSCWLLQITITKRLYFAFFLSVFLSLYIYIQWTSFLGVGFIWGKSENREYINWSHFNQAAKISNIMKVESWGKTPLLFLTSLETNFFLTFQPCVNVLIYTWPPGSPLITL